MSTVKRQRLLPLLGIALVMAFSALAVWPDESEARRFGGGKSYGSRGTRSFSPPKQATSKPVFQRNSRTNTQSSFQNKNSANRGGVLGGLGNGLLGGIGGLMMGGLIGSMLFGGSSSAAGVATGGGIGLFEILLFGGGIWFFLRWRRQKKHVSTSEMITPQYMAEPNLDGPRYREAIPAVPPSTYLRETFSMTDGEKDYISLDHSFDESAFLKGAKDAFIMVQTAWSNWSVERLEPLLTDSMWDKAKHQVKELKEDGLRTTIEDINFESAEASEVWRENGHDWITVHFKVHMIYHLCDIHGNVVEGDPDHSVQIEEYWTFIRLSDSTDPNWKLSAIQQPGEIVRFLC
jgi:predicted lipid-binding transport protein (Tim44 family)